MPLKKSFFIASVIFIAVLAIVIVYLKLSQMQIGDHTPRQSQPAENTSTDELPGDLAVGTKPSASLADVFSPEVEPTPAPSPTPDPAVPHILIKGRAITHEDGAPVAGATAFIVPAEVITQPHIPDPAAAAMAVGATDTEGRFSLQLPEIRNIALIVRKPGFADAVMLRYHYERIVINSAPVIVMEPGWTFRTQIVDARTNAPIPGAMAGPVMIDAVQDNQVIIAGVGQAIRRHHVQSTSDASGMISLSHLPRQPLRVPVMAPGYQMTVMGIDPSNPPLTIALLPGSRTARVKAVTSETGHPFANQNVVVQVDEEFFFEAQTDQAGEFNLTGLPVKFDLFVSSEGTPWRVNRGYNPDPVDTHGDLIEVKMPELVRMSGRVVRESDSSPVMSGEVMWRNYAGISVNAELNDDGRFQFPLRPLTRYDWLHMESAGLIVDLAQGRKVLQPIYSGGRLPGPNGQYEVELVAKPGFPVRGRMTFPGETTPRGAMITTGYAWGGATDATGQWEGLLLGPDDNEIRLSAAHPDFGCLKYFGERPPGATSATLTLAFEKPGRVWGEVISETTGEPVPGALLSLKSYLDESSYTGSSRYSIPFQFPMAAVSDVHGQFEFPPLQPGTYQINTVVRGLVAMERDVTVTAGGSVFEQFTLEAGETITGRVVYDNGDPVEGANVTALRMNEKDGFTRLMPLGSVAISGQDGEFQLDGLPSEGPISLRVMHNTRNANLQIEMPYEEEALITITRLGQIHFTALDANGQLVEKLEVELTQPRNVTFNFTGFSRETIPRRQPDGSWLLEDREPNFYDLMIISDTGWATFEKVQVRSGETTELGEITLKAEWGAVRVTALHGVSREPMADMPVGQNLTRTNATIGFRNDTTSQQFKTDANGVVVFDKLIPGRHSFYNISEDYARAYSSVELAAGETIDTTLDIFPLGLIRGVVLIEESRQPAAGAKISPFDTVTDRQGRFELKNVPMNERHTITAKLDGYIQGQQNVTIDPGMSEPPEIEILLKRGHYIAGRVTNEEGEAIASARVSFNPQTYQYPEWKNYQNHNLNTTTDEEGRYRMEDLPPVPVRVTVSVGRISRSEYSPDNRTVNKLDVDDVDFILKKRDSTQITIRAVKTDGSPVSEPFMVSNVWNGQLNMRQHVHASNGEFRINRQKQHVVLKAAGSNLAGRAEITPPPEPDENEEAYEIVMAPAQTLNAQVVDQNNAAIGEAQVFLFYTKDLSNLSHVINSLNQPYGANMTESQKSGADGMAAFQLPPGEYSLIAMKDGYKTTTESFDFTAAAQVVTIMMEQGGMIHGRLVDEATGQGQSGARVSVQAQMYDPDRLQSNFQTTTDENGGFEVAGLEPIRYSISLSGEGYHVSRAVIVPKDTENPLEFKIPVRAQYPVIVMQAGEPAPGIRASLSMNINDVSFSTSAETNAEGRATLRLPPGQSMRYTLNRDNANLKSGEVDVPSSPGEIVFDLADFSLTVRVTEEDTSEPIMGVRVQMNRKVERGTNWIGSHLTLIDGTVRFDTLEEGLYQINVSHDDYIESDRVEIEVSPQSPNPEVSIALRKGLEIALVLIDEATGQRLPQQDSLRLSAHTRSEDGSNMQYMSGVRSRWQPDGTIRVTRIDAGECRVNVTAGYYSGEGDILVSYPPPAEPIPVTVTAHGQVTPTFNLPEGEAANQHYVNFQLVGENFNRGYGWSNDMKALVPPGEYKWLVVSQKFKLVDGQVTVEAMKDSPVTINLTLKEETQAP